MVLKCFKFVKFVKFKRVVFKLNSNCKVLKFKQKNVDVLSDSDTMALVLGVVNLIKNNAIKKTEFLLGNKLEYYKKIINNNLSLISELQDEIKKLKGS